jgi:hypothetical protein
MRALRKALLIIAVVLVTGFGTLVLLAHIYEDEVKQGLIGALNEKLNAPVAISGMDLTLIARFPMASMNLHDVLIMEVRSDEVPSDTLLFAKELFLEFSLWGLFQGNYTLERIHGDRVKLYPGIDPKGAYNHIIWKEDSTSTTSADIALEKVSMEQLELRFRDARSGLEIRNHSQSLAVQGRFTDALNDLNLNGDLHLHHWLQGADTLLADRKADVRLTMNFGGDDGAFRITQGEVVSNKVPLELTLELLPSPTGDQLDLRANGLGLDLGNTLGLLPTGMLPQLDRYAIKGAVDLAIRYTGPIDGAGPALSLGAKVTKGHVKERRSGSVFSDISGELALDLSPQGVPRKLHINGFSARSGSGTLRGDWRSDGLTNALVKADLQVDIDLADLLRFAQVDTLEQVGGRLTVDARIEGRVRDVADLKPADLRPLRMGGTASLRGASLKLKGVRHRIEELDAELALEANDAAIHSLKATLQGSHIVLKGRLVNLVPYLLFDDQRLTIQADGSADRIDLAALLQAEEAPKAKSSDDPGYALSLPASIALDLRARVEELVFADFSATAINGTIRMQDRVLKVSPVTFNTASGAVLGSLELDARGAGPFPLAVDATFQDIDIKELFREFGDFGQDFIGHRHLSGRSQAKITLRVPLSPALELDMDRLLCTLDIAIDDGGIKGHAPLLAVADHLRDNRLVAPFVNIPELRKRLSDVRFARLENRIEIRDGAVHIPTMEVKSSAMDLELSGTHWFDDRIEHHLNFRLSDLFRMGKPTRDEFGPITDDGTGMRVFLRMYGTASDPQFSNDGAMAAARRKQQFQQEKQELKSVLREGFGIGKGKGTEATTTQPEQTKPVIEVEWGDEKSKTEEAPAEKPRKGLGKFLDKTKDKDEQERIKVEDP